MKSSATLRFKVSALKTCSHAKKIAHAVTAAAPSASVEVDLARSEVIVRRVDDAVLVNGAIRNAGFDVTHRPP